MKLADEFRRKAKSTFGSKVPAAAFAESNDRLFDRVEQFTMPVEGSLNDVENGEANRDPEDAPGFRATDKRMIEPEGFGDEALRAITGAEAGAQSRGGAAVPPPPPAEAPLSYFVARDGTSEGPFGLAELRQMHRDGRFTEQSLVFRPGGSEWTAASTEPALSVVFAAVPPPPQIVPPPPPAV